MSDLRGLFVRPKSLKEVSRKGSSFDEVRPYILEFLDEFYVEQVPEKKVAMLKEEPDVSGDARMDAYLAAVAEYLSRIYDLDPPDWVEGETRFLKRPFFPCGLESLKATMLKESPAAFRRRMIFVEATPLYRPRKDKVGIG